MVEESSNSSSSVQAENVRSEAQNEEGVPSNSSQQNPIVPTPKRRAMNPPELQEAGRQMNTALTTLNKVLVNKENPKEEDECDLFCKMLAKQIKGYPKLEREEIMYEIHGVMMNKRRRNERERVMQGRSYSVSSPAQVILSRPTSSNTVYLSSPSPNYVTASPDSLPQIISEEIIQPETSRGCYESFGNVINDDFVRANFIPDSH